MTLKSRSIKVQDGPLTSRLQKIQVGDKIVVQLKPVGTLVLDALLPGKRLYLFATGTGIAPFASLIRDPDLYERFDEIILTHTCRQVEELGYSQQLIESLPEDPLIGELAGGQMFKDLGVEPINPQTDRVMICGSMGLNKDMKVICEKFGLTEGSNSRPGTFVMEKAFAG